MKQTGERHDRKEKVRFTETTVRNVFQRAAFYFYISEPLLFQFYLRKEVESFFFFTLVSVLLLEECVLLCKECMYFCHLSLLILVFQTKNSLFI